VAESEPRELVRRLVEDVFNGRRPATAFDVLAPEFLNHNAPTSSPPGPRGTYEANLAIRRAFPDWTETIEQLLQDNDRVVLYAIGRGTHARTFMATPPTGRHVQVGGMAIFRIEGARIVEQWGVVDMLGMLRQIGAVAV
jgi:predicted ester cyclase